MTYYTRQILGSDGQERTYVFCDLPDGGTKSFVSDPANTDYQAFKSAVLNQQPGSTVQEDGDSFSLNTSPNDSILEDADGNVMTIDQAKEYVRTLP
jgi:hypothetical protein